MQIRDAQVVRLIEQISHHYQINIASRYVRPALLQMALEKQEWDLIEVLTEKLEQYRYQGFDLDYLYKQIVAVAQFVSVCRRDLAPNLRTRAASTTPPGSERVMWDMTISNFAANLKVFADMVNELYVLLVNLDKRGAKGHRPIYLQVPGLENIGRLLVGG
ncbi:hypothetical protein AGMMS49928_12720 [Spirochaetia bacterium]|nr:hypothetical protein AGMMS49928_12720 [Spirochaetia bacterium]